MQLSQILHNFTNIKITVARRQEWRQQGWNPQFSGYDNPFIEKLDNFAHAIRIGIDNFAFANAKERSPQSRPMIEVEGRLPRRWEDNRPGETRTLLRME
jgi:hypothetical protein